jgi:hypothetical protein
VLFYSDVPALFLLETLAEELFFELLDLAFSVVMCLSFLMCSQDWFLRTFLPGATRHDSGSLLATLPPVVGHLFLVDDGADLLFHLHNMIVCALLLIV